jgi:chromosome segregation ATPase
LLEIARNEIELSIKERKDELFKLQEAIVELKDEKQEVLKYLAGSKVDLADTITSIKRTKSEQKLIEKAIDEAKALVETLATDKTELERQNSVLAEQKTAKEAEISRLTETEANLLVRVGELDDEYAGKIAEKEQSLELLNAKVLDQANNLDKMHQEEQIIRNDLAAWQKRLEAKDQNLRIREAKVEGGEEKLIQNSNLLSL